MQSFIVCDSVHHFVPGSSSPFAISHWSVFSLRNDGLQDFVCFRHPSLSVYGMSVQHAFITDLMWLSGGSISFDVDAWTIQQYPLYVP